MHIYARSLKAQLALVCFGTVLCGLLFAGSAHATLIGDDAVIRRISGGGPSVTDFAITIGAGTELEFQGRHDLDASSIVLDWNLPGLGSIGFDSSNQIFEYLDLQEQGGPVASVLTGVALTTNVVGLNSSRILFSDDSVSIDLTALSVSGPNPGGFSFVQLDLTFTPVPEPGTALLIGAGLAVLSARRGRNHDHQSDQNGA
ncbi:MAG: PEP-CTERM sorting domain-containing protein [Myxococcota bacterium]